MYIVYTMFTEGLTGTYTSTLVSQDPRVVVPADKATQTVEITASTTTAEPLRVEEYTLRYRLVSGMPVVHHSIILNRAVARPDFTFEITFGGITNDPETFTLVRQSGDRHERSFPIPEGASGTYTSVLSSDDVVVPESLATQTEEVPAPTTTAAPVRVTAYTSTYEMNEGRVRHDITVDRAIPGEVFFDLVVNFASNQFTDGGSVSSSMDNPRMYIVYTMFTEGLTGTYTSTLVSQDPRVVVPADKATQTVEITASTTTAEPLRVEEYTLRYRLVSGMPVVHHSIILNRAVARPDFTFEITFGGITNDPETFTLVRQSGDRHERSFPIPEGASGTYTSVLSSDDVVVPESLATQTEEVPAPTTTAAPVRVTAYTSTYEMNEGRVRHDITVDRAIPGEVFFDLVVNFASNQFTDGGSVSSSMDNPRMYIVYTMFTEGLTGTYTSTLVSQDPRVVVPADKATQTVEITASTTTAEPLRVEEYTLRYRLVSGMPVVHHSIILNRAVARPDFTFEITFGGITNDPETFTLVRQSGDRHERSFPIPEGASGTYTSVLSSDDVVVPESLATQTEEVPAPTTTAATTTAAP